MRAIRNCGFFLAFLGVSLILYFSILRMPYYSDDYTMFFPKGSVNPLELFVSRNPYEPTFYRPFEVFYKCLVQYFFVTDTLFVHLMNVFLHGSIAFLLYKILLRLNLGQLESLLGSGLFLTAQMAAGAVARGCTMAQLMGCLFSLWFLATLYFTETESIKRRCALYLLFFLALVSKETSLFLIFSAALLYLVRCRKQGKTFVQSMKSAILGLLPYVILTLAYLGIRFALGLNLTGNKDYATMQIGPSIITNLGLLIFSNVNAFNSPLVFKALALRQYPILLAAVALNALVLIPAFVGLIKARKKGLIAVLVLLMGISLFPAAAVRHVSELYGYNAMPFYCALVAIGLGTLVRDKGSVRRFASAAIVLLLLMNVFSLQYSLSLMKGNAEKTEDLVSQMRTILNASDPDKTICMVETDDEARHYSYYEMYMTDVQKLSPGHLRAFLDPRRRTQVNYQRIKEENVEQEDMRSKYMLTVRNGQIVPYTPTGS